MIASLLTSRYEDFGLSIMESINYGCPVISYNVRYGPSELITNHENGILVKKMTSKGLRMQWKWLEIFISKM